MVRAALPLFAALLAMSAAPAIAQGSPAADAGPIASGLRQACRTDLGYLNQMFGWQVGWPREWNALATGSDDRIRDALLRWRRAPEALAAAQAALSAPSGRSPAPRAVVARILVQLDALNLRLRVPPPLRPDAPVALREAWDRLFTDQITPAINRFTRFLRNHYQPTSNPGLADEGCYRAMVRDFTSLNLHPDRIERIGRRLLDETEGRLARLYGIPASGLPALLRQMRDTRDPSFTADRLVQVSQAAIARARAALPRMFNGTVQRSIGVVPMAEAMEGSFPAGLYDPGAEGGPAAYVVNRSRPAERQLMAEVIAFHEGLPGHHIRRALGLPQGRFNSGFVEGWAVYAEILADEMGLYSSRTARAGMLAKHLWAATRLIVEPGLHLRGWTRAHAISFMRDHTALSDAEIELEVDRYIAIPGQSLSYMLGYERIRAARDYAERRMGRRFELRQFHDVVLAHGSRELDRMYADVVAWADRRGPSRSARRA